MIESPSTVLRRHGLSARKSWGQHFLHAMEVHRAIAHATGVGPGDRVLEIGAGLGTLTGHLLETGAHVWAIERDRDLCAVLRHELGEHERFTLLEADAVRFDYAALCRQGSGRLAIAGNLPYQLTGPLLYALLAVHELTGPWVVMVQKEVARRMCAAPGGKTYGSMTVGLSRLRSIRNVQDVPPGAFSPPPRVDSAVVRLDPLEAPRGVPVDPAGFLHLVRTTFQRRRKTLLNALGSLTDRTTAARWCDEAEVDGRLRPERLTVEAFTRLQAARERSPGDAEPDEPDDA